MANNTLQRLFSRAAGYEMLEEFYRDDPAMGPDTIELFREVFRMRGRLRARRQR
jgi:hypothetical protein